MKRAVATLLAAVLGLSLGIGLALAEEPATDGKPATPVRDTTGAVIETPEGYNVYQDWLDSNHELGQGDTECLMCAGFGGGFKCGLGCDATGISIVKPDGFRHHLCGVCVRGTWVKN